MKFLFNLSDRNNQLKYFKMKNKHGYSFTDTEKSEFIADVIAQLKQYIFDVDVIIFPETQNECFKEIVNTLNMEKLMVEKRSVDDMLVDLNTQQFMKAEKDKLFNSLSGTNTVKLAAVAGNQRKRFIEILFNPVSIDKSKRYLILDDSFFSGTTLAGLERICAGTQYKTLVLFDKSK